MTFLASDDSVLSSQDKTVVREFGSLPDTGVEMTQLTLGGKSCRDMIRLSNFPVFFFVTAETVDLMDDKTGIPMTLDTVESAVDSFQNITGCGGVVPFVRRYVLPAKWGMAVAAVAAQSQLVSVILAALPVTSLACSGCTLKNFVQVALCARNGAVPPREREVGSIMRLDRPFLHCLFLFLPQSKPMSD
jgi:hypothetical protein